MYKNALANMKRIIKKQGGRSLPCFGFTLIELLVVIAIIGILTAGGLVAFTGAQKNARDARRISDVRAIANVMELYKASNGTYPLTVAAGTIVNTTYFPAGALPTDPKNVAPFQYASYTFVDSTNGTGFCVCGPLEAQKGNSQQTPTAYNACFTATGGLAAGSTGWFCVQNRL